METDLDYETACTSCWSVFCFSHQDIRQNSHDTYVVCPTCGDAVFDWATADDH